jgi:acyl-ACP thioesterase
MTTGPRGMTAGGQEAQSRSSARPGDGTRSTRGRLEAAGVLASTSRQPHPLGRRFEATRPVRLADADPTGRFRLDALARHLQDVATDDAVDAGLNDASIAWVVRRSAITIGHWPRYLERLTYSTFCSGVGARWAERRTSVRGDGDADVEAAVVWVCTDVRSGRPVPPPHGFERIWAPAAGGRMVSARLFLPPPSEGLAGRPWQLRAADLDVLGHVNNAVYWAVVEDEMYRRLPGSAPTAAEYEYRLPIERGATVEVLSVVEETTLRIWLVGPEGVHASAVVRTAPGT